MREKARLHAFLKQTPVLGEIHNHNFYRTSKVILIAHAESKPLQAVLSIRIRPHKYVELLFIDPPNVIAIRTFKVGIERHHLLVWLVSGRLSLWADWGFLLEILGVVSAFAQLAPA